MLLPSNAQSMQLTRIMVRLPGHARPGRTLTAFGLWIVSLAMRLSRVQAEGLIHTSPGQRPGFMDSFLHCRPTACFITLLYFSKFLGLTFLQTL